MDNYQNGAINVPDYHGTSQRQWVEGALVGSAIGLLLYVLFHGDRRTVSGRVKLAFGWIIVLGFLGVFGYTLIDAINNPEIASVTYP